MFALRRSVRFTLHHTGFEASGFHAGSGSVLGVDGGGGDERASNGYAGVPGLRGLGRFEQMDVTCRGPLDPTLNYVVDIKTVDRAVRRAVMPIVAEAFGAEAASGVPADAAAVLARCVAALRGELGAMLAGVKWHLTPFESVEASVNATDPNVVPEFALLRQKFEFAASHRLHVPTLSAEENREAFGKCNHESGHGHNYIVEPCVEVATGGMTMSVGVLERLVAEAILDRYDHRYLNVDTPEFDPGRGGVVPSVENIAKVFFERLGPRIASMGARLVNITVWESERTAATYPG
jgi:6-pyruvoyltetrahydropterin/6-carboxytetrahydropterin synthase